jgi:anti-sigma B factor antagonist
MSFGTGRENPSNAIFQKGQVALMSLNPESLPPSGLKLQVSKKDGETLVVCSGRLTLGAASNFKTHVKGIVRESPRVVVDLSGVEYMDSSGLGAVVGVYVSAKAANCDLQLIHLNKQIRQLFGLTNLLSLFEPYGQHNVRMP